LVENGYEDSFNLHKNFSCFNLENTPLVEVGSTEGGRCKVKCTSEGGIISDPSTIAESFTYPDMKFEQVEGAK